MEALASGKKAESKEINVGVLGPNSSVVFEKKESSSLFLTGKAKASTLIVASLVDCG